MNTHRAVSVLLAAVAATMLVTGSFGFTSVSAERGVSVSVTDDDHAYINYHTQDVRVEDGTRISLVTIQNQLGSPIEFVNYSIGNGSGIVDDVSGFSTISPGSSGTVDGTIHCEPGTNQEVEVTLKLSGDSVSAQIGGETRGFWVTCVQPTETTPAGDINEVQFNGAGNVVIKATNIDTTNITYWTTTKNADPENGEYVKAESSNFNPEEGLKTPGKDKIVAVYFPEYDKTFVHPNYYEGNWGSGPGKCVPGEYDPANGAPDGESCK